MSALCIYVLLLQKVQKQQHAPGNPPRPCILQHHHSFNQSPSSAGSGQTRAQVPKRTQSHGGQIIPPHLPHIRISLDPGESLDLGLKQEISQQVREFRAQKLNQRGSSPGPASEHNQAPGQGQGQSKGPHRYRGKRSSPGPVNPSNAGAKPFPPGPSNHKDKPRDRPHSVPNQAAIQDLLSPEPHLMDTPQVQCGPIHVSTPAHKLVNARPRGRSHSPCRRIDVDVEPEYRSGWSRGIRPAVSSECLMVTSDSEVTEFDSADTLQSALHRCRSSFSPVSTNGNFLQVPNEKQLFSPPFRKNFSGRYIENTMRASSCECDLSASAPAEVLRQKWNDCRLMNARSFENLASRSTSTSISWLGLSPRTSPQTSPSYSPLSSSPVSSGAFSPESPFSPDNLGSNLTSEFSPPSQSHLLLPDQLPSFPLQISPGSSPYWSPYGSPFGSQTCVRSVGGQC